MTLRQEAALLQDDLVRLRRAIHQEPELGLTLPRTQEKVLAALDGLPLEITTGRNVSSVTAVLRGGLPGPVVLLRGDMDALPVTESAGVPYASEIDGHMHACGHDLHVAMLAGAARLLSARRETLPGSVIFMFQPGEEGFHGARYMLEEGLLEAAGQRPVAAYGLHVTSALYGHGNFACRRGTLMASASEVHVTVRGRGGHGSMPHQAMDPIPAACEMVLALQTFVTRSFNVFDPVVVTVGEFHSGTKPNIIPEEARFAATLRSFSAETGGRVRDEVVSLLRGIATAHRLDFEVDLPDGYPVTVNDDAEAEFVAGTVEDLYGAERYTWMDAPLAGAEDFSYVLQKVPGAYAFLGAPPPGTDLRKAAANHAPDAVFDDAVLADGAALLAELAIRRLSRR